MTHAHRCFAAVEAPSASRRRGLLKSELNRCSLVWSVLGLLVSTEAWALDAPTAPPAQQPTQKVMSLQTRLHLRYRGNDGPTPNAFEIRRARLALNVRPETWLRGQLDVDFSEAPALKDGFVRATALPWLRISAGQFKKPFGQLELLSSGLLPVWRRGIVTDRFVSDNYFGGRDIGLMADGPVGPFAYSLGVFNGNRTLSEIDTGKDAAARVTVKPTHWLRLGASGSLHYRNATGVTWPRRDLWAAGIDSRLRISVFWLWLEALWGMGGQTKRGPPQGGASAMLEIRLPKSLLGDLGSYCRIRPVAKVEVLDDHLEHRDDRSYSYLAGVNLHLGRFLRVFLQAERTEAEAGSRTPEETVFVAQLAWDHEAGLQVTP